jgi:hypothetical protein
LKTLAAQKRNRSLSLKPKTCLNLEIIKAGLRASSVFNKKHSSHLLFYPSSSLQKFFSPAWNTISANSDLSLNFFYKFGGVYSDEVTPDPFPNSEVKIVHGKTSTEEARRKASSTPPFIQSIAPPPSHATHVTEGGAFAFLGAGLLGIIRSKVWWVR